MIHTKVHRIVAALKRHTIKNKVIAQLVDMLVQAMPGVPTYVLTDELIQALEPKAMVATAMALMDAGVARLPHEHMLVELDQKNVAGKTIRCCIWITEESVGTWLCYMTGIDENDEVYVMDTGVRITLRRPVEDDHQYLKAQNIDLETTKYVFEVKPPRDGVDYVAVYAIQAMLLMSHTRGVAKETIDVRKLNKARAAKGKTPIPAYTIYRVGHVYTPRGERVTFAPGVKRIPHLRAGHVRKQKYGPGFSQERLVFIEPILVNCESADEITHKPRVVTW